MSSITPTRHDDRTDDWPAADWRTAPALSALGGALAEPVGVRSVVLVEHGRIAFEHHRDDVDPDAPQPLNSVTKSVLGVLLGIALHRGALRGTDATLGDWLPDVPPGAAGLTLWDLMTMRAGFDWDERQLDDCLLHACARYDDGAARRADILARPVATPPGRRFNYDSHAAHLLAHVLHAATGRTPQDYAAQALFAPLGITRAEWEGDEDGRGFGGRGLMLSARDLARIGLLVGRGGVWRGTRLLDEGYLARCLRPQGDGGFPVPDAQYGALWWVDAHGPFAYGFGEQLLCIDAARDRVGVVLADSDRRAKALRRRWADGCDALDRAVR